MAELAALVAVLASTLFAGAALYINIAEHPARLACGTELAATQFIPSYKRAAVMQVFLAATATLAGIVRGGLGGGMIWFVASGLIFAVIPFTLIAILPTNSRLLDPSRDRSSSETRALLEKWGRLHAVRSAVVSSLPSSSSGRPSALLLRCSAARGKWTCPHHADGRVQVSAWQPDTL